MIRHGTLIATFRRCIYMLHPKYTKVAQLANYNHLRRSRMGLLASKALDEVLLLPHPEREAAFVVWAYKNELRLAAPELTVLIVNGRI